MTLIVVYQHETNLIPPDEFLWHLMLKSVASICLHNSIVLTSEEDEHFSRKFNYVCENISLPTTPLERSRGHPSH
jgi:hypothetical protein